MCRITPYIHEDYIKTATNTNNIEQLADILNNYAILYVNKTIHKVS